MENICSPYMRIELYSTLCQTLAIRWHRFMFIFCANFIKITRKLFYFPTFLLLFLYFIRKQTTLLIDINTYDILWKTLITFLLRNIKNHTRNIKILFRRNTKSYANYHWLPAVFLNWRWRFQFSVFSLNWCILWMLLLLICCCWFCLNL